MEGVSESRLFPFPVSAELEPGGWVDSLGAELLSRCPGLDVGSPGTPTGGAQQRHSPDFMCNWESHPICLDSWEGCVS